MEVRKATGRGGPAIYSGPILDGTLVVETAQSAYEAGRQAKVPLIIGSNSAEVPVGFVNAGSKEELLSLFGSLKGEASRGLRSRRNHRFRRDAHDGQHRQGMGGAGPLHREGLCRQGRTGLHLSASPTSPASMQRRMRYGAAHASEIPYVFDNLGTDTGATVAPKDQEVARMVNTYWANFAKTGDPNGPGLPKWPRYDPEQERDPRVPTRWIGGRRSRSLESAAGRDRAGRQGGEATLVSISTARVPANTLRRAARSTVAHSDVIR